MALVPARDHMGEWLLLLDSTNGRDKFARLLQYSSKFLKWRAEVENNEQRIKQFNELMATMGMVRKVLRFFRSIAILRQLRAAIPADPRSVNGFG